MIWRDMLSSEFHNLVKWNGKEKPFYEVYYLKVNEPALGAALWLRYTFLSPLVGPPEASVWAIFFNSRRPEKNIALKETIPVSEAVYHRGDLYLNFGGAMLKNDEASGVLKDGGANISWNLKWIPSDAPFRHYPFPFYYLPWPKSKVIAPNLSVPTSGWFEANGVKYPLNGAKLHQGHIWGRGYSKNWAWANCGVFNEDRSAVLELLVKPPLGTGLFKTGEGSSRLLVRGRYDVNGWSFIGKGLNIRVKGKIAARHEDIIGVTYQDPVKGERYCYNTKVADAVVDIYRRKGLGWRRERRLVSNGTTAFEVVEPKPLAGYSCRSLKNK